MKLFVYEKSSSGIPLLAHLRNETNMEFHSEADTVLAMKQTQIKLHLSRYEIP